MTTTALATTTTTPSAYASTVGLAWRTMRLFGSEISHLRAVLNARFPNSGGGPVIDLTTALDAAEWQKSVPLELTPDAQLAYRIAWTKDPHWRIGPAQLPAYRRILDQLPTTLARTGVTSPPVLIRETVGALREHHAKHHTGTRHYDQVITTAITSANLDQVRMPLTLTDTTTELLRLLHDTAPNDATLADLVRRLG